MYEESHEDVEAEGRIGVVGCVCDEAFRELVKSYSNGCLKANRKEGVCGHMMVMLADFEISFFRGGAVGIMLLLVRGFFICWVEKRFARSSSAYAVQGAYRCVGIIVTMAGMKDRAGV